MQKPQRDVTNGARYLTHAEAHELLRMSSRALHELVSRRAVPHRRPAGTRRLLYLEAELRAFVDGAELEAIETAGGGRVVRPKARA